MEKRRRGRAEEARFLARGPGLGLRCACLFPNHPENPIQGYKSPAVQTGRAVAVETGPLVCVSSGCLQSTQSFGS